MKDCKSSDIPVAKVDKFSLSQCPKNEFEREEMQKIPYVSTVGSLMYARVCSRSDIAYTVGMLGRYLTDPSSDHWKAAKWVLQYLQRTKHHMLTYKKLELLEIIRYSDFDFAGCQDSYQSTSGYVYLLAGEVVSWKSAKQTLIAASMIEN